MANEQTGTASTAPEKPKDLSLMSVDELDVYINDLDSKHKSTMKYLRALSRAKSALAPK